MHLSALGRKRRSTFLDLDMPYNGERHDTLLLVCHSSKSVFANLTKQEVHSPQHKAYSALLMWQVQVVIASNLLDCTSVRLACADLAYTGLCLAPCFMHGQ